MTPTSPMRATTTRVEKWDAAGLHIEALLHASNDLGSLKKRKSLSARGDAGAEYLEPVPNDFLQCWPVSKKVNSSKADADDVTLIEKIETVV
jgi:hypothetical protein